MVVVYQECSRIWPRPSPDVGDFEMTTEVLCTATRLKLVWYFDLTLFTSFQYFRVSLDLVFGAQLWSIVFSNVLSSSLQRVSILTRPGSPTFHPQASTWSW